MNTVPLYPVETPSGSVVEVVNILRVIEFLELIDSEESAEEIISALPETVVRAIAQACQNHLNRSKP